MKKKKRLNEAEEQELHALAKLEMLTFSERLRLNFLAEKAVGKERPLQNEKRKVLRLRSEELHLNESYENVETQFVL